MEKELVPDESSLQCRGKGSRMYPSSYKQRKRSRKTLKFIQVPPSQDLTHWPSNQLLAVSLSLSCHMKERKKKSLRRGETSYNYPLDSDFL